MSKLRRGQVLQVTFLDHVQGHGEPLELVAFGRLLRFDRLSLTILSWTQADPSIEQDPADGNNVSFTILRSTVKSLKRLTEK